MKNEIRHITVSAVLVAFSLALFAIELLVPPFPFSPSAKVGLANIITLFMLTNRRIFRISDCFLVLVARCLLAALITGRLLSVAFSLSGGMVALIAMLAAEKFLSAKYVVLVSVAGAISHNLTQMLVAFLFYGTFSVVYYIPALFLTGVFSGILTGLCVVLINRSKFYNKFFNS